jgi:lipopolysaccharide biosynthesis regulator YciM
VLGEDDDYMLPNRAEKAATLFGLGMAHRGNGDDKAASESLKKALGLYRELGDDDRATRVENVLVEMGSGQ